MSILDIPKCIQVMNGEIFNLIYLFYILIMLAKKAPKRFDLIRIEDKVCLSLNENIDEDNLTSFISALLRLSYDGTCLNSVEHDGTVHKWEETYYGNDEPVDGHIKYNISIDSEEALDDICDHEEFYQEILIKFFELIDEKSKFYIPSLFVSSGVCAMGLVATILSII